MPSGQRSAARIHVVVITVHTERIRVTENENSPGVRPLLERCLGASETEGIHGHGDDFARELHRKRLCSVVFLEREGNEPTVGVICLDQREELGVRDLW